MATKLHLLYQITKYVFGRLPEKAGKDTVDLEAAKKKPTTNKEEGSGNTNPSDKGDNTQGGGSENGGESGGTDGGGTDAGSDGNMG